MFNKKRLIHDAELFGAAFAVTALSNADHLFAAHGLDAVKSAGIAVLVTALKAAVDVLRAQFVK